jgi:tRNA dimethylallyltransferase
MELKAVLIAGPTASGKSGLALALAEALGGTVVNADSMQVYRELRVLTARPSLEDEARAPHRLYGHIPVRERYSAGRYCADAQEALADARASGRIPIVVGGTGLYFDALTKGLSPIPPVPPAQREETRARFDAMGRDAFLADLVARDATAARLRPSDTQRLLRAADVLEATGRPLSSWQEASGEPVLGGEGIARFVLDPPRDVLAERIARRAASMFEGGAIEEARAIPDFDPTLPAAKILGLPQLRKHFEGRIGLEDALLETQIATRQYAKRQRTWFRNRMKDWKWFQDVRFDNIITVLKEYYL